MESSRFSNRCFPISTELCLPSKYQSKVSYLSESFRLGKCWICTPLWDLDGPELPENAFSLDIPRFCNLYFCNSTYLIFISMKVSTNSFILEACCSFLIISKLDLCLGIGILIGQKWKKCFLFRHISKFQLILLEKYGFEVFYQILS